MMNEGESYVLTPVAPSRSANSVEISKWAEVRKRFQRTSDKTLSNSLYHQNLVTAARFAQDHELPFDDAGLDVLERRMIAAGQALLNIKTLCRMVEDNAAGIQIRNGDIDIMVPSKKPAFQGAGFEGFMIPLIVAGVVALAGVIGRLIYLEKETDEIGGKYNQLLERTDSEFCKNPESQTCVDWQAEKVDTGFEKNKTIGDTLREGFQKVSGGLGAGLLLAIPVAAYLLLRKQ